MATQLWFDFSLGEGSLNLANFCNGRSNADARSAINRWRSWPSGVLILTGPRGCGKSHLAHIWLQTNGAKIVHSSSIPSRLTGNIIVEHADQNLDEEGLFHLMNRAMADEARVLLTARTGPRGWGVKLGDLRSRLNASEMVRIDEPDDDVLAGILTKLCKDRLIKPDEKLIEYLIKRMERSSSSALNLVEALNARSLENCRPVRQALAREILQELDTPPQLLAIMEAEHPDE